MATTISERTGLDLSALDRAIEQGLRATRVAESVWTVSSHSRPGHNYVVREDGDGFTCECPGAQHNLSCKHVAFVKVLSASNAVPVPTAAPLLRQRSDSASAPLASSRRHANFSDDADLHFVDLPF